MAHYALVDENNIVTQVFVGRHEWEVVEGISDWEEYYGNRTGQKCVRTSYNHNIRKQYAGIGYSYDEEADVFVAPKPYESWVLDENHDWQPPFPMPDDGKPYEWSDEAHDWIEWNPQ